jgi:hypothetical protein
MSHQIFGETGNVEQRKSDNGRTSIRISKTVQRVG